MDLIDERMSSLPPIKVTRLNRYGIITEYTEDHFGRKQGRYIEKTCYGHEATENIHEAIGDIISECFYKDDQLHGTHTRYSYTFPRKNPCPFILTHSGENYRGIVLERTNYTDGVLNGPYEKFYENGQPRKRMTYVSGSVVGRIQAWDAHGNITEDWIYPS